MRPFHQFLGSDPIHDHLHHFETSWLLPPYLLASLRALFSLYAFVTIFFIFGWNGQHSSDGEDGSEASRRSFSYFTHLSFWGVAFYFLVSAVHTFLYARTGRSVLFDKWPRVFRALHSLFYTTITNFPFVVLVVYWTILFEGPWFPEVFDAWTNISQHALPSFLSLFEILLSTTLPPPISHLPFLWLLLLLYLCVAYLTHATQGFYTYSFLDPGPGGEDSPNVAGMCFGILGGMLAIFIVVWILHKLRGKLVGGRRKLAARDLGEVEMMEVRAGLEGGSNG